MRYLSLDLETTGLDESRCQILQLAAVYDDTDIPLDQSPTFNALVWAPTYAGEPYALALNQEIFKTLATASPCHEYHYLSSIKLPPVIHRGQTVYCVTAERLVPTLEHWLIELNHHVPIDHHKIVLAGKNVAGFDLKFLRKLPGWNHLPLHHRVLDPGNLFLRPDDKEPPGTEECLRRAGFLDYVAHDALEDALDVCKLIRNWKCRTERL
jgi:oligoribonuclease (3'-5' exoribonuclease)